MSDLTDKISYDAAKLATAIDDMLDDYGSEKRQKIAIVMIPLIAAMRAAVVVGAAKEGVMETCSRAYDAASVELVDRMKQLLEALGKMELDDKPLFADPGDDDDDERILN